MLQLKFFKICCAFNFFQLIVQFYILNLTLFHFDRNIDKCWPFLVNYSLFFCLKLQKNAVFILRREILIANLGCNLT